MKTGSSAVVYRAGSGPPTAHDQGWADEIKRPAVDHTGAVPPASFLVPGPDNGEHGFRPMRSSIPIGPGWTNTTGDLARNPKVFAVSLRPDRPGMERTIESTGTRKKNEGTWKNGSGSRLDDGDQVLHHLVDRLPGRGRCVPEDVRASFVAGLHHLGVERDRSQVRHVELP